MDRAKYALRVGLTAFIVSIAIMFVPALLDLGSLAKYVVVFTLIGTFTGLGCLVNGAVDLLLSRNR